MDGFAAEFLHDSFAAAVAAYLLVRMDRRLEDLTKAVLAIGASLERFRAISDVKMGEK
ncbi:MAG: YvrJ family protein [Synergistes sp.]|nr:YvrJ family protein [Synergistes sp.]